MDKGVSPAGAGLSPAAEPVPVSSAVAASIPDADTYRGWKIGFEYGRYVATGPDYDCSYEGPEDGWVSSGGLAESRTLDGLHAEIDCWFDEQVAICPACNGSGFGSQDLCGFCGGSGGVPAQAIEGDAP